MILLATCARVFAGTHFLVDIVQSIYFVTGKISKLRDHVVGAATPLELLLPKLIGRTDRKLFIEPASCALRFRNKPQLCPLNTTIKSMQFYLLTSSVLHWGFLFAADLMIHLKNAKSPRIIATHLPYNMLPKKIRSGQVKVSNSSDPIRFAISLQLLVHSS